MAALILSLDTSTPWMSAALLARRGEGLEVLATRRIGPPEIVSTRIPGVFDELLEEAGASLEEVGALVAGLGPGLFTGVRVAAATMKAIAYARRLPLIGAGTLEAMALAASRGGEATKGTRLEAGAGHQGLLCPVLDARKGELYAALYRVRGLEVEELVAPLALSAGELRAVLERYEEPVWLFGSGLGPAGELPAHVRPLGEPVSPAAAEIAALALLRTPEPHFDLASVLSLEPGYLRPPEAELARRKREEAEKALQSSAQSTV